MTSQAKLTEDQVQAMRDAFNLFDKNGDGHVSKDEIAEVMRACHQNPTDADIKEMIAELDDNNNGFIEFPEFQVLMAKKGMKTPEEEEHEMMQAFMIFDRNGDGFITTAELRHTMGSLGEPLTNQELDSMIEEADFNRDGKVDYKEFCRMMAK